MKFYALLVVAILLLSAVFRIGYPDLAVFGMDGDAGACEILDRIDRHQPPKFIGTSHGMFTFSIMNVLFHVIFLFVHDPRLIILLSTGIPNTIAVILLFLFCVKFIGRREALIATALFGFSDWSILYSKSLWGVCTLQFFIMMFFCLLAFSIYKYKSKTIVFPMLMLPILPSLHLTTFSVFVAVFLIFLIYHKRLNLKYIFVIGSLLVITILLFIFARRGIITGFASDSNILTAEFSLKAIYTSLGLIARYPWFYGLLGFGPRLPLPESINGLFVRVIFVFGLTYIIRKMLRGWRKEFSPYIIIGLWFFVYVITMGFTELICYGHYLMVVLPVIFIIAGLGFISLVDNFSGRDKIRHWEYLALFVFFMLWNPWITILVVLGIALLRQINSVKKWAVPALYLFLIFIVTFQAISNIQLYGDISKKGGGTGRYGITLGAKIKAVKYIINDAETRYRQSGLKSGYNAWAYSYLFRYLMRGKEDFISSGKKDIGFYYTVIEDIERKYIVEKSPGYIHDERIGPVIIIAERIDET